VRVSFRQYWNLLATYLAPQGKRILLLGLLLLSSIGLQLFGPQILREFIDRAIAGEPLSTLVGFALLFLALALVTQGINLAEVWVAENVGWIATNDLRGDLALHVLRLDPAFHNTHTPGVLIERVDGDVAKLGNFFSRFTVQVLGNGLLGIGVLVMLFRVDWRVGGAMTLFAIISIAIINALRDIAVPFWAAEREASANLFGFIEERLSGTEDIRAAGATDYVMRSNYEHARDVRIRRQKAAVLGSVTFSTSLLVFAIGTAVSLGLGAWLYLGDEITIGTVFLIYQYTNLLNQPIEQITRQMQDLQQAGASVGRVQELLDTRSSIVDGAGVPVPPDHAALAVDFDRVTFGYNPDEPVVKDIDFHLAPGTVLGLVGRTGSGKTTITRLLSRLQDPTAGVIRVGGIDLREYRLADLREQIGLVTQDIQLFRASVRDNLTLFDERVADDRIIEILRELGLSRWLDALPEGLDSMLAAGGGGLSAGEAQLLAFTRVFLSNPRIVILDEASSRLDPATERRLEQAIDRLLAGRTGIVIAHRLATVYRADDIMVLHDGVIVEYGNRIDLMANPDSRFSQMLRTGQGLFGGASTNEATAPEAGANP
jgi:ABC-type multidrug transport system fused ATPase/permease subunit